MDPVRPSSGPWPRRLAQALVVCTFGLLLAGGLVTTYRVGMAVPDWPTTFGQGMFSYPLAAMLEDSGVTIEHGHRLFASGVGVLCILMVLASVFGHASREVRVASVLTLLAVCAQGVLGGTRVLENSRGLAFLHGAFAQLIYGLVAALWVLTSPRWAAARAQARPVDPALARAARTACLVVYLQIVLGAWLRHSGRLDAMAWHLAMALAALAAVVALGQRLAAAAATQGAPFATLRRWVLGALVAQIGLGVLALASILGPSGGFEGSVSLLEAVTATLHVAVGALLLAGCVASVLWTRAARAPREPVPEGVESRRRLEGVA